MRYQVLLHPKANMFLEHCEHELNKRIKQNLKELQDSPERGKKLAYSEFWRLRIGDYRAIYEIDHENHRIIILYIGHRKEVYDDFSRLL